MVFFYLQIYGYFVKHETLNMKRKTRNVKYEPKCENYPKYRTTPPTMTEITPLKVLFD